MSDQCEEQEMEAEALAAIFDAAFEARSSEQPFSWAIRLVPIDCGGDEEEEAKENHVAAKVLATIPLNYPESLPELDIEILKGLAEDQRKEILNVATTEAEANAGMPAIFAVCEAVRAWLADNNEKGLDDGSMHAQMMRKMKDEERRKAKENLQFESQHKKAEDMSEAELEDLAKRKQQEEGTPCTEETFRAWKAKFDEEMEQIAEGENAAIIENETTGKKKEKADKQMDNIMADRLTGYDLFSGKSGIMNLEALEAAAEDVENSDSVEGDGLDVDADLFADDDDLDDLDFDDEDSEEDSDEDFPDI